MRCGRELVRGRATLLPLSGHCRPRRQLGRWLAYCEMAYGKERRWRDESGRAPAQGGCLNAWVDVNPHAQAMIYCANIATAWWPVSRCREGCKRKWDLSGSDRFLTSARDSPKTTSNRHSLRLNRQARPACSADTAQPCDFGRWKHALVTSGTRTKQSVVFLNTRG
jgi:hypothetical protein